MGIVWEVERSSWDYLHFGDADESIVYRLKFETDLWVMVKVFVSSCAQITVICSGSESFEQYILG